MKKLFVIAFAVVAAVFFSFKKEENKFVFFDFNKYLVHKATGDIIGQEKGMYFIILDYNNNTFKYRNALSTADDTKEYTGVIGKSNETPDGNLNIFIIDCDMFDGALVSPNYDDPKTPIKEIMISLYRKGEYLSHYMFANCQVQE